MARARRSTELGEPGFIQVHARMPEHPKVAGLSDRAFRLLVESWCWSWRNKTDGHIPTGVWAKSGTPAARRELTSARLVDPAEGGVALHDWSEWQETVAARERLREVRAEAGSKGGKARASRLAGATADASQPPQQTASNDVASATAGAKQNSGKNVAELEISTPVVASGGNHQTASAKIEPRNDDQLPSRRLAAELAASSRRVETQLILSRWETGRGSPLVAGSRPGYVRAVDDLLNDGVPEAEIAASLPVLAAKGLGPNLLASVIEEQRGKRANTPIHLRRPEDVTDAELTWQALAELLGEDSWMPPACPDEIDQGPPDQRRAWFAARRDERLAERRAEARRALARNAAVTT